MPLKPDRHELYTDVTFRCDDVTNRGVVVVFGGSNSGVATGKTGGSGAAMDNGVVGRQMCQLVTDPSGFVPLGYLLTDVVNVDTTKYRLNVHKNEVNKGGKVLVLRKGWLVTDQISGTPKAGDTAYVTTSGKVTPTNSGAVATPKVGLFITSKDEDGYAKVAIDL